ncbi:RagB/SusD family nutrient uptake outer membrane protein [Muricauda sp. NFXS6]|uniref:RagB/SusD family nutrient uptake outer membrane protein n=1 Tax=Allomuricauda sp. NFXS6 TaxID=2819094 RepID=UPI0032DE3570
MKYLIQKMYGKPLYGATMVKAHQGRMQGFLFLVLILNIAGCTDFVDVDPPKNTLVSKTVFDDASTVESAMANLYFGMREQGMVSGTNGVTPVLGIYGDELDYYGFSADLIQLYQNDVLAGNGITTNWWRRAYHLVYGANDIIRGVEASEALATDEKNKFLGQALFVRAYLHSQLVLAFGDVPYITATDYRANGKVSRMPASEVYSHIISDLTEAADALDGIDFTSSERVLADLDVVKALLARIYLYEEEWEIAASLATDLIHSRSLENDLDKVFLKDSQETIWQLKADTEFPLNTREGEQLIISSIPGQSYALTEDLLTAFETDDMRKDHWVGSMSDLDNTITLYFAHKYKADINETESLEYSILFRLAEQYLIRAEARVHLGNLAGSQADLNAIRGRAGLPETSANTQDELLGAILQERRVELFTEQGLRWFDLQRTGMADQVMSALKPNWQATDVLLPIPESELEANPKLLPQNNGY